ncbi:MAG: putative aminohydrolase SsnA [Anaerolineaceae bacterium]
MIIVHANVITFEKPNGILVDHSVRIDKGIITDIGESGEISRKYHDEETIDAGGQYLMPGKICAHTHFYGAFSRGLAIPGPAPENFLQILEKLWWPLDKSLTLPDVKYSALVFIIDAIRNGTTTLIDHHASPNAIEGSLDVIENVIDETGIRASLCYEVTDRDGKERAAAGIKENTRFIERIKREKPLNGRVKAMFGLHASLTLSNETLTKAREAAGNEIGFHIHAAESTFDEYDSLAKGGDRVVDRLEKFGILGPKTIVAHAVHVDAREIDILKATNTWVTHQPRSNMNNAVGLPAVESMLRYGINVCLGNDGFSNAMWEEWKAAYLSQKLWNLDPRRMGGSEVLEMAVYNNRLLANQIFEGENIGVIQAGAAADIILVDYHPFTPLSEGNLPWHILFGFSDGMVTTTIVAGKILMKDRKLVFLDEERIAHEAGKLSPKVWERFNQQFQL